MVTQRMPPAAGTRGVPAALGAPRGDVESRCRIRSDGFTFKCSAIFRSSFWTRGRPTARKARRRALRERAPTRAGRLVPSLRTAFTLRCGRASVLQAGSERALERGMRRLIEQIHDRLADECAIRTKQLQPRRIGIDDDAFLHLDDSVDSTAAERSRADAERRAAD